MFIYVDALNSDNGGDESTRKKSTRVNANTTWHKEICMGNYSALRHMTEYVSQDLVIKCMVAAKLIPDLTDNVMFDWDLKVAPCDHNVRKDIIVQLVTDLKKYIEDVYNAAGKAENYGERFFRAMGAKRYYSPCSPNDGKLFYGQSLHNSKSNSIAVVKHITQNPAALVGDHQCNVKIAIRDAYLNWTNDAEVKTKLQKYIAKCQRFINELKSDMDNFYPVWPAIVDCTCGTRYAFTRRDTLRGHLRTCRLKFQQTFPTTR